MPRAYHFGSQGSGDVYSNHTSHTNRLIPVYAFGSKVRLGTVTGENSRYRDPLKIKELYGALPQNTANPEAVYADQSDLYRVQKEAIAKGAKHLFIVWFDGLDWPTTLAAAIAKTGTSTTKEKGRGCFSRTTPPRELPSMALSSQARPTIRIASTSTPKPS